MRPPVFKLNTGASIPSVGLGTWQSKPTELEEVAPFTFRTNNQAVIYAIDTVGYRLLDGYIYLLDIT
jgi:glycerol 2-dehydrogenase (NADP+)